MNWQKFHTKLNKINILTQSADNDGLLSSLEQDLLASYIRELYEILYDEQPVIQTRSDGFQNSRIKEVVKEVRETPPAAPLVIEEKEPEVKPEPVAVVKEIVKAVEQLEEKKIPETTPVASPVKERVKIDKGLLEELFAEGKMADLSDKLASQKIPDLAKAMGINEKIFTIQELFNNDNNLFNQTISQLNTLTDFQAAQTYLSNDVIPTLDWTSDKKIKKAATFIKLVRRRFM
ncbi:MAG: hypothetical protein WAT79_17690 [Saprospiraceae bacterium]